VLTITIAARAIATATHLARDDRGPERVLGAPVSGVEGRVEEKTEDGLEFDHEVLVKAPDREAATRRALQELPETLDIVPARDGEAVLREVARA